MSGNVDSIQVSFATNIRTIKTTPKSLSWVVEQIRTSKYCKKRLPLFDQRLAGKATELKKELLPYFSSAIFDGGIRGNKSSNELAFQL